MSHAGDTLYIAGSSQRLRRRHLCLRFTFTNWLYSVGMRGILPNNTLAPVGLPRVRQAYQNMAELAEMVEVELDDCLRLVVYTTNMEEYRDLCNQIQIELWGDDVNSYPPRTIVEVDRLNEDDIVEVEGTFYMPRKRGRREG